MNIIEVIQTALLSFPGINALHTDYNGGTPDDFGLYPTGDKLVKEDVLGSRQRSHNFILYADFQSFNDYDRLQNSGTLLELQGYLEKYADGQTVELTVGNRTQSGKLRKITCQNGMLFSIPGGSMNAAVRYQLQITADYTIESEEL